MTVIGGFIVKPELHSGNVRQATVRRRKCQLSRVGLTFPLKITPLAKKLTYAVMGPTEEAYDQKTPYLGTDHRRVEGCPGGVSVQDLCRKHGISDGTFYKWRTK